MNKQERVIGTFNEKESSERKYKEKSIGGFYS